MGRVARKYPTGRFFLRTPAKIDEEKLYPVYLCYFIGGKKIRQSTSIMAMTKDWNQDANHGIGELRASYGSEYKKRNQQLQKLLRKVDGNIFDYVEMNGEISPDIIQGFICGDDRPLRSDKGQNFVAYALDVLGKQYKGHKIKISTYDNSVSILNQFTNFLSEKEGEKGCELYVGNITEELVRDFVTWGLGRGRKTNTVKKYLELICKICRCASEEGLLCKASAQLIADIEMDESLDEDDNRTIKYMTIEEIGRLANINPDSLSKKQLEVIDMILFAIYACGLRVSDIITLRWSNIIWNKQVLRKKIMKTRRYTEIPLSNDALEILSKWKDRHKVFIFGLLNDGFDLRDEEKLKNRRNAITSTINKSLKKISEIAQLNKKVTTHYARHSFGVHALEQGIPTTMISKLMDHKTTYVTEDIYADYLPSSKKEAVNKLIFKPKG